MNDGPTKQSLPREQALRRRTFALESRSAELELQLRRLEKEEELRSFELAATQRELLLRDGYGRHLELELGILHKHAIAVAEDRDRVAARMRELEQEVLDLRQSGGGQSASSGAIAIDRVLQRVRRFPPAWALLRLGYRVARFPLRAFRRVRRVLRRSGARA